MKMFQTHEIEDFILDRLDSAKTSEIQLELESNDLLKFEVELQSNIIQSIKDSRFTELKSLLQETPVPPLSLDITELDQSANTPTKLNLKSYIGSWVIASVSIIISTWGIFYSASQQPNRSLKVSHSPLSKIRTIPLLDLQKLSLVVIPDIPVNEEVRPIFVVPKTMQKPNIGDIDGANTFSSTEEPIFENNEDPSTSFTEKIFVSTKSSKTFNFHYQFKGNQLFLFGDFSEKPYHLYGNIKNGLYLFLQDEFYLLDPNKNKPYKLNALPVKQTLKLIKHFKLDQ